MSSYFLSGVWFHYCMMTGWSVSVDDCVRYRCAAAATSARRGVHWQSLQYWDRSENVVMFDTKFTTMSTLTLTGVARNWSCEGRTKACKAENQGRSPRSGLGYLEVGSDPPLHQLKGLGCAGSSPVCGRSLPLLGYATTHTNNIMHYFVARRSCCRCCVYLDGHSWILNS